MICSYNKYITEIYQEERSIKSVNMGGFAMVSQKITVKGLKTLVDAQISDVSGPRRIPKGSVVYIKEEYLMAHPWAKSTFSCDAFEGNFLIVPQEYVELIVSPETT